MQNLRNLLIVLILGIISILFFAIVTYLVGDLDWKNSVQYPTTWILGIILWIVSIACYFGPK